MGTLKNRVSTQVWGGQLCRVWGAPASLGRYTWLEELQLLKNRQAVLCLGGDRLPLLCGMALLHTALQALKHELCSEAGD